MASASAILSSASEPPSPSSSSGSYSPLRNLSFLFTALFPLSVCSAIAYWLSPSSTISLQLYSLLLLDFFIQFAAWAYAAWQHTEIYYDLTGAITYVSMGIASVMHLAHPLTLVLVKTVAPLLPKSLGSLFTTSAAGAAADFSLSSSSPRSLIATGCLVLWSARLGTYLFSRVLRDSKDSRFDKVRDHPALFLTYWAMQGLWVFLVGLPVWCINSLQQNKKAAQEPLGIVDYIGLALWLSGFLMEVTADAQKDAFRRKKENKGRFIQSGLWFYSRHPNYMGEILLWIGMWVLTSNSLKHGWELYASLASPVLTALLLRFVSGVPLLEKSGDKKWGKEAAYQEYKKTTPVLLPNFFKSATKGGSKAD